MGATARPLHSPSRDSSIIGGKRKQGAVISSVWLRPIARLLAIRGYLVRGDSMAPNAAQSDLLLVDRSAAGRRALRRGAVVISRDPFEPDREVLKRVVGLPGEEVSIVDGLLRVDGIQVSEPYLHGRPASLGLGESRWRVGDDECFLMGDNRVRSVDSRRHGPVNSALVEGTAWFRCWPPGRFGRLR